MQSSVCGKRFAPPPPSSSGTEVSRTSLGHLTPLHLNIRGSPQKMRRFSPLTCTDADDGVLPCANVPENRSAVTSITPGCDIDRLSAQSDTHHTCAVDVKQEPTIATYNLFPSQHWYNTSAGHVPVSLEQAAFEKVRAEIAEILSPMSDVSHSPLQPHDNNTHCDPHGQQQHALWSSPVDPTANPTAVGCDFQKQHPRQHDVVPSLVDSTVQPYRHNILASRDQSLQPHAHSHMHRLPSTPTTPFGNIVSLPPVPTIDDPSLSLPLHSIIPPALISSENTSITPRTTTATTFTTTTTTATTTCTGASNNATDSPKSSATTAETQANDYYFQNNNSMNYPQATIAKNGTPTYTPINTASPRRRSTARRRSTTTQQTAYMGSVKVPGRASTTCATCGKTYTESSNLSKHIRTVHLKLRPFSCNLCGARFAERNKLGKHVQSVHERARPFRCDVCSATFSQASDRKRHRLVLHEGCRPFACTTCGKAFGRRSSLTQHCARVHKALVAAAHNQNHSHTQQPTNSASLSGQTGLHFGTVPHLVSQPLIAPPIPSLLQHRIHHDVQEEQTDTHPDVRTRPNLGPLPTDHAQTGMPYTSIPSGNLTPS